MFSGGGHTQVLEINDTIGGLLNLYTLGWWCAFCLCLVVYAVLKHRKDGHFLTRKASIISILFFLCIIHTIVSIVYMQRTGRGELVSAFGIFNAAWLCGGLFSFTFFVLGRVKSSKVRDCLAAFFLAVAVFLAADGARIMVSHEKRYGCAAQAEIKRIKEQQTEAQRRMQKEELPTMSITVTYVPHFWRSFFEANPCAK